MLVTLSVFGHAMPRSTVLAPNMVVCSVLLSLGDESMADGVVEPASASIEEFATVVDVKNSMNGWDSMVVGSVVVLLWVVWVVVVVLVVVVVVAGVVVVVVLGVVVTVVVDSVVNSSSPAW